MRNVIQEIPVSFEQKASGVADVVISEIDLGQVSAVAKSDVFNVAVQFPSDFDDVARMNGMYNARFWIQNLPGFPAAQFEYELSPTPLAAISTPVAVPRTLQETENIDKATYYDDSSEELGVIALQIDSTTAPTAIYNTAEKDRSDPALIIEWERQTEGQLDADIPNPESDHLWDFSQVDLYVNVDVTVSGSTVQQRFLLGYMADEDFTADLRQETVDFKKGKPTATAVVFMSEIVSMIGGQLASSDPWLETEGLHIAAKTENNMLVWEETNKQRPISIKSYTLEWVTNSGHLVRIEIPRGQFFFTGEKTPGASEISKQAFEIRPLVNPGTKSVYKFKVSKSTVQRVAIPIKFDLQPV